MHKYIFIFLLSILLKTSFLNAEIIKNIEINGNKRVSDETIKIYGNINLNKDYSEKDLNDILNNLFSTKFFEDINISLNNNILRIDLKEYPVINSLIILGEPKKGIKEQIKKLISLKQKSSFIKNNLSQDIEIIKKLYASIGYNFAQIDTKIREIDDRNVDLVLEVIRGNQTKISKITFTGDKKVREKRLIDIIASEEDKFWKFISKNTKFSENLVNLDIRLLSNYYKSIGYYDVKVTSNSAEIKESGNVEIIYSIDPGIRYIIRKISTNVDPIFDKDLFFKLNNDYKKVIGSYYSPFKIKKLLDNIDELIDDNNLQFVEHNVEESIENNSIEIKFNIFEGEKILIERINILGNSITNESVIRSELLIDEGDPFTQLGLDKSIANIKSRNIFSSVNPKVADGASSNLKIIDISVEEKSTGEISAGAGVGTNGGSFAFSIKENNWLGEGKSLGFDLDVNADSIKGTFNFTDPNYDFLGNSIDYFVLSSSNDKKDQGYENSLTSAGISTRFEQYKDLYASIGLAASYDDLRTQSTATESLKKQSGNFKELALNYGFTSDKRNRSFMPTSGSILSFNQSLPLYADRSFISNSFAASTYKTFSEDVIGASKFLFSAINGLGSDDVRLSKRKSLSTTKLRGFKKGQVGPIDGNNHIGGNYITSA